METTTTKVVLDGTKMDNEKLGNFTRRSDELKRRINEGTLEYEWVMDGLQMLIERPKSAVEPTQPQPEPSPLPRLIVLDTDPDPFIPSGLRLKGEGAKHRGMGKVAIEKREDGQLYIDGKLVELHLSPNQKDGKSIQGYKLAEELKDEPTLNARILDALYENQQLIPEDWKKVGRIYFWATKFRGAGGRVCVGCLDGGGSQWYRDYDWLRIGWGGGEPAARLAKN
jgi:hypothetical protein